MTASVDTPRPAPIQVAEPVSMIPLPYRVVSRRQDTSDTATVVLEPVAQALPAWSPGQFTMVYAFGVGEIPISVSGGTPAAAAGASAPQIHHTVRSVGAVSAAIVGAPIGTVLGLRGPFGQGWPAAPEGQSVVVMAGGIGLAPLRPVITSALERKAGRLTVLIGARTPGDLLYTFEYDEWRAAGATVLVTVDRGSPDWTGPVGLVTTLLDQVELDPAAIGYVCGPDIMMRLGARALSDRGDLSPGRIYLSLERNMKCGVGLCGHCQLGPVLICRDGPVTTFDHAEPLLLTKEL